MSGVQAGPNFFPGFSLAGADPNVRFALFAYAYYLPDNSLKGHRPRRGRQRSRRYILEQDLPEKIQEERYSFGG
ncbi:MAG: hypothetical protein U0V70_00430 [Terriglobia bacterium]